MLAKELDTEIPVKPRRSISRATSRVAWRRPGVAIRFRAGRGEGIVVSHKFQECRLDQILHACTRSASRRKPGPTLRATREAEDPGLRCDDGQCWNNGP